MAVFEQMLDLDGRVVRQSGKLRVQGVYNGHGVAGAVEKIRVTEGDVLRSHGDLLADVGEHDVALHDPKNAVIDGDHRAMPAQMLTATAGFGGTNALPCAVEVERGVGGQNGELGTVGRHKTQPVERYERLVVAGADQPFISLDRLRFVPPDRSQLPVLSSYATLYLDGARKRVGSTEASRGCKHLCRHCPVVPVYNGAFRIVQRDVVLADIRQQVAMGAEHITFGDPDFFNGPGHAMAIVDALHAEFPGLTYDATIKIEHLLKHRHLLPRLKTTGCLFIISAVESINDQVLTLLDKGHTRADFDEAVRLTREAGLTLTPTFVTFTPRTTLRDFRELLETLIDLDLVENVAPIQLAIRLLIPAGSRLRELPEMRAKLGEFDSSALSYQWRHDDPAVDRLCAEIQSLIQREERQT